MVTTMPDLDAAAPAPRPGDVAVIGMNGRFPGAPDLATFWTGLRAGRDMITSFTDAELAAAGVPEHLLNDPRFVKRAAILPDAFDFDHEFFGYSYREAELMDPQQRILLEIAWELLETIGYAADAGRDAIGVFAGAAMNTYLTNVIACSCDLLSYDGTEIMLTNDKDYLTTRISYKLGLKGPSVNVQTACSTSLVAVHLAVQSLLAGECDIALAGGVCVLVNPYPGYLFQEGMMMSPDGWCRPFDAAAAGTAFGDGAGMVALKRLTEAIRDGDQILAVVKGSAVNNDGSEKIGYTAPSIEGQRAVITEAQAVAEVDGDSITYVEAHGTATALGDPIEFTALCEAFDAGRSRRNYCALGSVKANIGHLAAAAGIAGFIKVVQALMHREIPGHPHFVQPNPEIDLADSPFYINKIPIAWPAGSTPRRAAVSSFGVGGTNAHVVIEEAPEVSRAQGEPAGTELLALSAKTGEALLHQARQLADALERDDAPDLADVAYTLRAGRRGFAHRHAVLAADTRAAAAGLRALAEVRPVPANAPAVSFLFGEITAEEFGALEGQLPAFARIARRSRELSRAPGQAPMAAQVIASQAIATLWTESGVRPGAVGGAGAGEVLAGCFAGVLDPADALALLAWRAGQRDDIPALRTGVPRLPIFSAVTGGVLENPRALDPGHWTRDVWNGSRLAEAVASQAASGGIVLAIGSCPAAVAGQPDAAIETGEERPPVARLLCAAGRLWSAGLDVDWSAWQSSHHRRVPLPVHPMNRKRLRLQPPPARGQEPSRAQDPADWIYAESWQRLASVPGSPPSGKWLVFADSGGVGNVLIAAFRQSGGSVVLVRQGEAFERTAADSFTVNPADPDDYATLFAGLSADGPLPERIVHLWSLDTDPKESMDADSLDRAHELGLFSVLDVARQAARGLTGSSACLAVVARGVHNVLGDEVISPAAAMTDAAITVVQQEFPWIRCHSIDVGTGPVPAEALLAEVSAKAHGPVALRHSHRWVPRFVPVAAEQFDPAGRLRPGGVYLITGGLGRIGLILAEHLARTVGAKLVLAGRSAFPRADEFDQWIAEHGKDDPISRRIERIWAIERLGGAVLAASADVTDQRAMAELAAAARRRFGRVDGWFHAASLPMEQAARLIDSADRAVLRDILAPKVHGALVLAEVLGDSPLDFGCMMSSVASVVGGIGNAGYAAANRFLDAVAERGTGLVSIDWEGWGFPDARPVTDARSHAWQELRQLALSPAEGVDVLDLVLRCRAHARLAVSTTDLERRIQRWTRPAAAPSADPAPRQLTGEELKRGVAKLWAEVLRTEIDRYDQNIFDLGGDSLLAVRLARRIEEEFGMPLSTTELLEAPTIDQLAARLQPDGMAASPPTGQRAARRTRGRTDRRKESGL
jgi:acyl transferase domain-containing protein/acyl carrier protein